MIAIDKQYYYIDIDAINDFVLSKQDINNSPEEEEIIVGPKNNLIQKTTIKRQNTQDNRQIDIRYDMVKTMLEFIYNSGIETENGNVKYLQDIEDVSIGTKLIFNTLLIHEFIKNKLD